MLASLPLPVVRELTLLAIQGPASQAASAEPDWVAVGLVLAVVGSFLLGNAILLRPPRTLVEELFGKRTVRLHAIREYVFHRAQVGVGFAYLLAGFALQLFGRYRAPDDSLPREFPVLTLGLVLLVTLALLALAWFWAARSFRRHVRRYLKRNPTDLEAELTLAREIGELFGVAAVEDDTVGAYLERLHRALDLPPPARGRRREIPLPPVRPEEIEAE